MRATCNFNESVYRTLAVLNCRLQKVEVIYVSIDYLTLKTTTNPSLRGILFLTY